MSPSVVGQCPLNDSFMDPPQGGAPHAQNMTLPAKSGQHQHTCEIPDAFK